MVKGIAVYGVRNLRETFSFLAGECALQPTREDLEKFFGKKIFLETHVKVADNWRKQKLRLRQFGYLE